MKNLLIPIFTFCCTFSQAQIITEIMYNPPESGVDSLEYIEIYNNTDSIISFTGYNLIGVNYDFATAPVLEPGKYLVVCKDSSALLNNYGATGHEWTTGALSNSGEELGIINPIGDTILSITYSTLSPWPTVANGGGSSIELCDINNDFSIGNNWNLSQGQTGILIDTISLLGTPGAPNSAACQIRSYTEIAITEILYEQPSWNSDLQYIELHNFGQETVNISDWKITGDIDQASLPNVQMEPDSYYIIGSSDRGLLDFGISMDNWTSSNKISLDPQLNLINPNGDTVVTLLIDEDRGFVNPEPGQAIELCDPMMDNNSALNWVISDNELISNGQILYGTPSVDNTCTIIGTSSVTDDNKDYIISLYPNPTDTEIHIYTNNPIEFIEIYNQQGSKIRQIKKEQVIQVSDLMNGLYYVRAYYSNGFVTKSFIKM